MITGERVRRSVVEFGFCSVSDDVLDSPHARGLAEACALACTYDGKAGCYVFQDRVLHPVTPEEKEATVWRNT